MKRLLCATIAATATAFTIVACGNANPARPSPVAALFSGVRSMTSASGSISPDAVVFPPRNEPLDFLDQLEIKYRDQLRSPSSSTFVNHEGQAVWMPEYLRYRVNQCSHADAVSKVFTEIDTGSRTIPPECGAPASGEIPFPPRNEPLDFLDQLENKYRNGLHAPASTSYVNHEGNAVWMPEYLRYRLNNCGHSDSISKVFTEIDSGSRIIPPTCGTVTEPPRPPQVVLHADFNVISTASGATSPQCRVQSQTGSNGLENALLCTFDASISTGAITSWSWVFPQSGSATKTLSGQSLSGVTLQCGSFGDPATPAGTAFQKTVTLTVTGPGGTDTNPKPVTFVKFGAC